MNDARGKASCPTASPEFTWGKEDRERWDPGDLRVLGPRLEKPHSLQTRAAPFPRAEKQSEGESRRRVSFAP